MALIPILNLLLDPLRFARPGAPGRRAGVALGALAALAALAVCSALAGCSPQDDTARTDDATEPASSASVPTEADTGWRYIRIRASAADAAASPASMAARASQDPRLAQPGAAATPASAAASAPPATPRCRNPPPGRQGRRRGHRRRDARARRYLAHAGDCAACHDAADHTPYAGGQPVNSPFGPIYAPNITPDPTHGIGHYTLQQFDDALRRGVRADGSRLYPAMPYPSFARLSADDVRALYAYFMRGVAPSANAAHATRLPFPFNQRWALALWRVAFASDAQFEPQPSRSAEWNRGAYLVQKPATAARAIRRAAPVSTSAATTSAARRS